MFISKYIGESVLAVLCYRPTRKSFSMRFTLSQILQTSTIVLLLVPVMLACVDACQSYYVSTYEIYVALTLTILAKSRVKHFSANEVEIKFFFLSYEVYTFFLYLYYGSKISPADLQQQ